MRIEQQTGSLFPEVERKACDKKLKDKVTVYCSYIVLGCKINSTLCSVSFFRETGRGAPIMLFIEIVKIIALLTSRLTK